VRDGAVIQKEEATNICYISFNQLHAKGAVNIIVDGLCEELNKTAGFSSFIMAEKTANNKNMMNNERYDIRTYKTIGGRFYNLSITVTIFLRLLLLKNKPDIIHLHQMATPYFIPLYFFSRLFSVPIVITNHNFFFARFTDLKKYHFFKDKGINEIYINTYFVCLSKEIYEQMVKLGIKHENLFHIPNGVDPQNELSKKRCRDGVIWIGRYGESKNIPLLFDVARLLSERGISIDIFGFSESELSQEEQNALGSNNEYVRIIGYSKNIYDELDKTSCLLVTSKREANSLVILEALSCGVPVVSTPVSAAREVLTDHECGIVVNDPTAENLADAGKYLLSDKALWEKMSHNAVKTISEFYTTEIMVEAHKKMYREIISRRHGLAEH